MKRCPCPSWKRLPPRSPERVSKLPPLTRLLSMALQALPALRSESQLTPPLSRPPFLLVTGYSPSLLSLAPWAFLHTFSEVFHPCHAVACPPPLQKARLSPLLSCVLFPGASRQHILLASHNVFSHILINLSLSCLPSL